MLAERSPPPPGCCSFSRVPSFRLFPVCTLKDICQPPAVEIFHAFLPSAFFMFGLFLCVEYLLPATGYIYRSFVSSHCFSFCFRIFVCAFLCFVCWWEPTTLCLKGRSDGVTWNIKYETSERTCANTWRTPHHRHTLHVLVFTFSSLFLCKWMTTSTPPNTI